MSTDQGKNTPGTDPILTVIAPHSNYSADANWLPNQEDDKNDEVEGKAWIVAQNLRNSLYRHFLGIPHFMIKRFFIS
jgi:hypothetical protein